MAFDRTNTVDLQLLQDEVLLDPISMGYAALPYSDTKKLLKTLNESIANVGGETAGPIFSHEVLMDTWEAKGALNEMLTWIEVLAREEGDITRYEAKYRANCGNDSLAALDAVTVPLSRAEVLFGQSTVISKDDWYAARDYQGA